MKQKFLLLTLLAVFAAVSAFGQTDGQKVMLHRAGFTHLSMDGQVFSFREANRYIDNPETLFKLRRGLRLEKAAIGLGLFSVAVMGYGTYLVANPRQGFVGYFVGAVIVMPIGGAMGLTALILGATGAAMTHKAINRYNRSGGYHSGLRLGIAPTPGGLGLQLTF